MILSPSTSMEVHWPQAEHVVQLVIGGNNVILPQRDVHSIETVMDIVSVRPNPGSVGQFTRGGEVWPVYVLSGTLRTIHTPPDDHRIVVLLKYTQLPFGILCQHIVFSHLHEMTFHPMPQVFYHPRSPLVGLVLNKGEVYCATTAEQLGISIHGEKL